ncbi:MAG: hypothetical protein RIR51_1193 [Bacteroidota bacterium]|jgi:ApaG protein
MSKSICNGIQVDVSTAFVPNYKIQKPYANYFSYQITIKNLTSQPVQLISRYWNIWDSVGVKEEINGMGVVGLQPTIGPYESFSYTSGCPTISNFGRMKGSYILINLETQQTFSVKIPQFELITPFSFN